ncbi:general secretion pathway protein GspB [Catenovulum maritimum]|uniref:Type II secretion system protein GspB C-terminal domain-containing protein n=1 Tax=Catenovulum maritimum TaxID=1513271 RepID=A0A0J8JN59_9ALTE|nr:general secretion pathway protein GspB [Catenovulum maritimum]KMT66036.1 hypothetical protein XM47_06195 [Catenovulum maritimum]
MKQVTLLLILATFSRVSLADLVDPTLPDFSVLGQAGQKQTNFIQKQKNKVYKLQALTYSGNARSAIINNKVYQVGDRLSNQVKLIAIENNYVLLNNQGKKQKLLLNKTQVKSFSENQLSVKNNAN